MKGVATCPICEKPFDERSYQLVVPELGAFDSVGCAQEALRRRARLARQELAGKLLEAVQEGGSRDHIELPVEPEAVGRDPAE
jgi:hypothetical protein